MMLSIVGGKDSYLRNKLLDHVLGGGDFARPATVYIALYSALADDGAYTEAAGGGYARLAVTNDATNWPAATGDVKRNGTALNWAAASSSIGAIVGAGIHDAASGGNRLYYGPFGSAFIWNVGQTFTIPANSAVFTEH